MALRFRGLDTPIEVVYWKGGSAPVPDPQQQAAAEKGVNRYNISGPTGTQSWQIGPKVVQGYDAGGHPIYGTQDTQTTTLSPTEQRQFDVSNRIAESMLGGASGKISGPGGLADTSFSYDTATPAAAKAAYQHQVELLQPEFAQADKAFEQKMTNMGLPVGSDAYNEALRQHEADKNTALTNASASATQQGAEEALTQRQQQYNELAAAMGGQQVEPVGAFAGGAGAPVDISGAYNQANQARLANYNAGQRQQGNSIAGGSALAAAAIIAF